MITKSIKSRIKEYFLLNPTAKLRVRQIEREVKVPLPSAIRYANELKEEGILKQTDIAGVSLYSADRSSKTFLFEKKLFNLRQLFSSGLIEFLVQELSNPTILVFGSYSRGEDIETSDIDLYIESPSGKKCDIKKFERALHRNIQIFQSKKIRNLENKELAENIINGITLNGHIEVFL